MKANLPFFGLVATLLLGILILFKPIAGDDEVKLYPNGIGVRNLSPAPKPGVHPRIFLSPEDLPAFRETVLKSPARKIYYEQLKKEVAEKLDNPTTPEGQVMAKLALGQTPSDAEFASATELSRQLFLAGIDVTVQNDAARGAKLATALNAWGTYQLHAWVRKPDPVGLHNSFDNDFCLAYDFIAPWMSEPQRVPARKFIAKMMNGIHIFTYDMPPRWRMWNWAALHVYQGYGSLAIEGEDGYTPQLWDEARMVVRDVGKYNIHPSGALTEDLTYFTLGVEGTGLVMIAMSKRGEQDVWATSNFPQLRFHLLNQLYPWGGEYQSHADGVGSGFYTSFCIWKYMYPEDPIFDYTWRQRVGEDYSRGGAGNDVGIRTWVATLFGTQHADKMQSPADFKQPLTYFCPDRGYLVTRTGWDADAVKVDFEAKQDYPIMGHNHADANNFNLDALGRMWVTDTGYHMSGGHQHNEVLIDGVPEAPWPMPGGRWVDLIDTPDVTIGVSDAKHAYDYHWSATGFTADNNPPNDKEKWEKETDPKVAAFYAGQENRKRTGIFDHWTPFLLRSVWNPVQKAFRTLSLVRGSHPYVFIVDDIRKDDAGHLYEWIQQMPDDVEILKTGGSWVVLGAKTRPMDDKDKNAKPQPDNRRLLVQVVDADSTDHSTAMTIQLESFTSNPNTAYGEGPLRKRLDILARGVDPHFKVLLYPFIEGAELPEIQWNEEHTQCAIVWKDQRDTYAFGSGAEGRTLYTLERDGKTLAALKAAPPAPLIVTSDQVFTDAVTVAFANPAPGQEIHYTLDGSTPTIDSPFYGEPIRVMQTGTIQAATFARTWLFGDDKVSAVTSFAVKKETPKPAFSTTPTHPGLKASIYQGYWNNLPDFSSLKPLVETAVDRFVLPPQTPVKGFGVKLEGYVQIPLTGVYTFGLTCDDAGKLCIDDEVVIDADGPHVVQTRTGQIALAAGWHKITVANCDNALPHGKLLGDGSWAFSVSWIPPYAGGLAKIPANVLASLDAPPSNTRLPSVTADKETPTEPGLYLSDYDQTAQAGQLAFFDVSKGQPIECASVASIVTPDSSPNLLHDYRGYLKVPHPGVYQFQLASDSIGEVTVGASVVFRAGLDEGNLSLPVTLEAGNVPLEVKLAKNTGPLQWKGPGMDWQNVGPENYARAVRPHLRVNERDADDALYEFPSASKIALELPPSLQSSQVHYQLDGKEPTSSSPVADGEIAIDHAAVLKAQIFTGGKPVGQERTVQIRINPQPAKGMIGLWPAAEFKDGLIPNQVKPGTADLPMPVGTKQVDDPLHGKVLDLVDSPKLIVTNPGILKNDVSVAFWIKPTSKASLVRYGYAHFGFFFNVDGDGSVSGAGGGHFVGAKSAPGADTFNQWHQVTLLAGAGDDRIRMVEVYIDGKSGGAVHLNVPCLTQNLEFLEGYSGQLAEIRLYNRILSPDEIAALASTKP